MSVQNDLSRILEKIREIAEKSSNDNYIYRGEPKHYKKVSSTLYRQYEEDIEAEDFDIEFAQSEMLTEAKDYVHETDEKFEILTQLQHFGGKTNLIDFTTDYLIALFFACESLFDKPGRVILLGESAQEENRAKKPRNIINRVRDQKSVFARPLKGFIEIKPDDAINIPKCLKQPMLDYLKKYHGISTKTIYNDLHGFIINQGIHEGAYTRFYRGFTCQNRGDEAATSEAKQKEYEKSIGHYTQAIQLNPNHAPTYYNRGLAYYKMDEADDAFADFNKAIELNPNYAEAYSNRGIVYYKKGEFEHAIEDYTKAIELNPNYAPAYNNRGIAYRHGGNYERAIEDCARAIELDPNNFAIYANRGLAYNSKSNYERAIKDFDRVVELKPDDVDAYINRGVAYYKRGEFERAIEDYTKTIDLNPNYVDGYYNRGEARLHLEKWGEAKIDLIDAKDRGRDIIVAFHEEHGSVADFQKETGITLPEDIAEMLTPIQS